MFQRARQERPVSIPPRVILIGRCLASLFRRYAEIRPRQTSALLARIIVVSDLSHALRRRETPTPPVVGA